MTVTKQKTEANFWTVGYFEESLQSRFLTVGYFEEVGKVRGQSVTLKRIEKAGVIGETSAGKAKLV